MSRRYEGSMNGERYLGNRLTKQLHDLDNEQDQCLIDEIIKEGNDVPFSKRKSAEEQGYTNIHYCAWK